MRVMEQGSRQRRSVVAVIAVALIGGVLAVAGADVAVGQEAQDCGLTDLGTLGAGTDRVLQAEGRWTTEDCDSRFRAGSDAHTYRFEVRSEGRIRIELSSAEADGVLYLLDADRERIADNDDGAGLDARIERDLEPGSYLIEATTLGGRGRGPADFTLTVGRVAGCEPTHLGSLEPGADLTATGSWTLDTCGSRVEVEHPAHNYLFDLPSAGRVRIELTSKYGDPVLYFSSVDLPTLEGGEVGTDDDDGGDRNSRIERYLPAGNYFIEATTYYARDRQPLHADFTLTVSLVDEAAQQAQDFRIKVEKVHIPGEVVAGDPLVVNYRVGNAGRGDLGGGNATFFYVVGRGEDGRRVIDVNAPISQHWPAGVSYHSDAALASATSVANPGAAPLEITFGASGPAWLFVGAVTEDAEENEIGFHGSWHNLMVLSGPTFEPVKVEVDGTVYRVSAEADEEGEVTTSVTPVVDPEEEVDEAARAKATYAAGVRTQLLEGIFERPAVAALAEAAVPSAVPLEIGVADPSSTTLLGVFGTRYVGAVEAAGLPEASAAGEAVSPVALEELALGALATVSGRYATMTASWGALLELVDSGEALSFEDAFAVQSQLAYAESIARPSATAGRIIGAARDAEAGWDDAEVRAMLAGLGSCDGSLRDAFEAAGVDGIEDLLALDVELRAALAVWGPAIDSALCAAAAIDSVNSRFLERLGIDGSEELVELLAPEPPQPAQQTYRLRVIARSGADGRVEHGVELAGGLRLLPDVRYLRADAPAGEWRESSDVESGDGVLGRVRARRLPDGRIEMGFVAGGEEHDLDIRYLPADLPVGIWFRSSEIEVTSAPAPSG